MPKSVGYPPDLKSKLGPKQGVFPTPDQIDTLKFCMSSMRLWANTTQRARQKFLRDFQYAEGNGKQWLMDDRNKVIKQKRPVLEFNNILPQVELVSGLQRSNVTEYVAFPRGVEDKRLSEVVTATLKATGEYVRLPRKNAHVFDDGTICGLGVWKILHNINDAKDILWGDITVDRIHPCAFMWDTWASPDEGFQDGAFMGDLAWQNIAEFIKQHPDMAHLAKPGEWIDNAGKFVGDSTLLGVGDNLRNELYNAETGQIRIATIWRKVPTTVSLMVNLDTGQVTEVSSQDDGQAKLAQIATQFGKETASQYGVIQAGETTALLDQQSGQVEQFAAPEAAQQRLDQIAEVAGMGVYERMKVIKREARVPYWVEMVWGQILEEGKTPYKDRLYPYVPYVSRMLQDDPESIMGIVRNLWDPQDELNKRYSNLLAHSNSSSHSGWLNKKGQGANTEELKSMGAVPGIVVEYTAVAPVQIHPVEMSQGHFAMIQNSQNQILKISGVNAEMVGTETKKAVSGRAIKARQDGGQVILKPRQFNFDESCLDVANLLLSRIQQYYPPQKIKRIVGLSELASGMMIPGISGVFSDPVTGNPLNDQQIFELLVNMQNLNFDLSIKQAPADPSVRQEQFDRAVQLTTLMMQTGRIPGPATLQALVEMSDMPSRLEQGMKIDAMMPPMGPPQPGTPGQPATGAAGSIKQAKGGHESDTGGPGPGGI